LARPRDLEERREIAALCAARLGLSTPILIDGMENAADRAYNAWPERLYVVGRDGSIAYKGGKGPFDFKPEELEGFLQSYR
jgi:Iodothyronine deiodinase